ncbi:hypothetical protein TSO221_10395 [Azospirillum sp. TSO22-1]|nr:hypothetical protein TSO221_10395 [Azospirillum sp. TSO22-1]
MLSRRILLASSGAAAVLAVGSVPGLSLAGEAVPPEVLAFGPEWATLWLNASPPTRHVARRLVERLARMSDEQLVRFADRIEAEHEHLRAEGR